MEQPSTTLPPDHSPPEILHRRPRVPSWVLSTLLHAVLIVILGLTLRPELRGGATGERIADVGIVLKHQHDDHEYYESEGDTAGVDAVAATATAAGKVDQPFSDRPPLDPSDVLPAPMGVIGPGVLEDGQVAAAGNLADGPPGRKGPIGGGARTSVFGVPGEGFKFVYVFDRSGSMGGPGRSPLNAAKAELIKSLDSLGKVHQFQIIFYNERPWLFNPSGKPGRLAFANQRNKEHARRFVGSITADGATRHEDALLLAIKLQPDVIFFLTDADEPQLLPGQLEKIRRRAAGIIINAIEFGWGLQSNPNNFLVRLARQNGGTHAYVDVTKLRRR